MIFGSAIDSRRRGPAPGSEFDDFLFAPIGEDSNGLLVSVVSLLGRLDLDPWQEAAGYATLPPATATEKLAALIGALPGRWLTDLDPVAMATRLIGLLPRPVGPGTGVLDPPAGATVPASIRRVRIAILFAICLGLLAAFQFFIATPAAPAQGPVPQYKPL